MIFFYLIFPILAFSHVIQDDVSSTDKTRFSLRTVCDKSVTHEAPLIEIVSGTEIDCMGKKISIGSFCEKELAADPYFLRAYIDKDSKEVVCHSGKKVIFKYLCVKLNDKLLCDKEASQSCKEIQLKLAKRLDIVHSSFTKNDKGIKQLNCYFESLPLSEKK